MNWKDWILPPVFQRKASDVTRLMVQMILGQPIWTPRNYEDLAKEGYNANVWVFRCVKAIAEAVAGVDWVLYQQNGRKRDTWKELENHSLIDLLYKPNELMSKAEFFEAWAAFTLLAGNSYIEQNGPNIGAPRELWPLRPDRVKVIPDLQSLIGGYVYQLNGQEKKFEKERVMHLKFFNPLNDFYGLSPIEVAARGIDNDNAANKWNNALLNNSARPSGAMVKEEGNLSEPQYDRLKGQLEQSYKGASNAGKFMLLEGGLKWVEMGLSPKDMDFIQSKKMSRTEICAAFGVPPEIVGDKEHATYSNYKEARQAFYQDTVLPMLDKIRDKLNADLVPKFGERLYLDYDKDSIEALQENTSEAAERTRADFVAGLITLDEARQARGYEAIEGGNVRYIPANVIEVGPDATPLFDEPINGDPKEGKSFFL